ncbi:MAG: transcriptional regulator [Deltaproteobacteria bacterium]|nr:transcriptional regulator [Deltaproteobacteria bacterium]
MEPAAPSSLKVIKRYANRKLYDTERSCYVTLDEIAAMIKRGEDVKVVDNKSGEDLSAVTLAQIIFEEEKKKSKMPLSVLRNIIQSSSETISGFINEKVQPTLEKAQGEWDKTVGRVLHREGEARDGEIKAEDEAEPRHILQSFVKNSQRVFDDIQKRVDERVRETVGAASHYATMGKEFEQLKTKVEGLERKLQTLLQK